MFRSESLEYYHLLLPSEQSWEILNKLGNLSKIHFIDLNSDMI